MIRSLEKILPDSINVTLGIHSIGLIYISSLPRLGLGLGLGHLGYHLRLSRGSLTTHVHADGRFLCVTLVRIHIVVGVRYFRHLLLMIVMSMLVLILLVVFRSVVVVNWCETAVQIFLVIRVVCMMISQVRRMMNCVIFVVSWRNVVLVVPLMVKLGVIFHMLAIIRYIMENFMVPFLVNDWEFMMVFLFVGVVFDFLVVSVVLILIIIMLFVNIQRFEGQLMRLLMSMMHRFLMIMVILMSTMINNRLIFVVNRLFMLIIMRLSCMMLWVMNLNPLLALAWLLLNDTMVRLRLATVPEFVDWHVLLMLDVMLNWFTNMMLIVALLVSCMSRVNVQMCLVILMLITIMLLFMILHVLMHHLVILVLLLTHIARDLVLRMRGLIDEVLHIVLLLVVNGMSHSQISNFLCTQSLLLRLGRGHSCSDLGCRSRCGRRCRCGCGCGCSNLLGLLISNNWVLSMMIFMHGMGVACMCWCVLCVYGRSGLMFSSRCSVMTLLGRFLFR